MGELLGLGLSHYPGFMYPDDDMSMRVKQTMKSPKVPAELKDPKNWPAAMQAEWGTDEGTTFAAKHREQFFSGVRKLRAAIDDFKPDAVVIFGDDQYENFHEDIIPPFCVYICDSYESKPFLRSRGGEPRPNVWGEPFDKSFIAPGNARMASALTKSFLEEGFDMSYSYKFLHMEHLGHAFTNTLLYLDYDRKGWDYPIIPIHINAYGSSVVRNRGGSSNLFEDVEREADPPSPSPRRSFELGQALARIVKASPWRIVVIGSSSWSHAFLTAKNGYVYPDVESDRRRFAELSSGNFTAWRDLSLEEIEDAGEQEVLNWIPLAGAMYELGQQPAMCEFVERLPYELLQVRGALPAGHPDRKLDTPSGGGAPVTWQCSKSATYTFSIRATKGPVHAVRGVSFTVEESAFYTLLGPSGCGKTSTLRSIAGLETPSSGEITIGDAPVFSSETGRAIPAHKRDVGMVFQSYAIWPHMSVFRECRLPAA